MIDWQDKVGRAHLVCAVSGTAIEAGATFYSALRFVDGHFVRTDYSAEHWDPSAVTDLVSWWKQSRPADKEETGPRLVNHAVLLAIWNDLRESTDRTRQCFAWVLTLLLTRSKKLRFVDIEDRDGTTWMLVTERGTKLAHRVRDPRMTPAEEARVEQDLQDVFTVSPAASDPPASDPPQRTGDAPPPTT